MSPFPLHTVLCIGCLIVFLSFLSFFPLSSLLIKPFLNVSASMWAPKNRMAVWVVSLMHLFIVFRQCNRTEDEADWSKNEAVLGRIAGQTDRLKKKIAIWSQLNPEIWKPKGHKSSRKRAIRLRRPAKTNSAAFNQYIENAHYMPGFVIDRNTFGEMLEDRGKICLSWFF